MPRWFCWLAIHKWVPGENTDTLRCARCDVGARLLATYSWDLDVVDTRLVRDVEYLRPRESAR